MSAARTRSGFTGRIERGPMAADVFRQQFTQIYNAALRDRRLSRRARGLLAEILTHRDGFGVSMAALLAGGPEGKDALTSALKELERYGYLHRERERNQAGQLGDTIFKITDMPDGLLLGAEAPWQTPEQPPTETRRSEPEPENPPQADDTQNRRSEPKADFPAQAEPAQAQPPHKKNNSSCFAGEEDSLSRDSSHTTAREGGERGAATPDGHTPVGTEVPGQRDPSDQDAAAKSKIVDAYASVLGRPVLNGTRLKLESQATEMLALGLPESWLCDRARELAEHGWSDLAQHVERSTVPIERNRQGASSLPEWCGDCGDGNPAARHNPRFRTLGDTGSGEQCPRCHPERVLTGTAVGPV
ncbi:hypothetical protein ACFWPU_45025 [Streptomyces sp. NPDC058471]|uniref:hypothetical protein n=1 Tax=Streptomyces sp. NPDC058471 TaxID=3346516 RepID=UPI0036625C9C